MGVEFASIYNSFGTQVTILEALPRVVPVEDEEISAELDKSFKKKNIQIQTGCKVESVKKDAKGVTVSFTDKDGKKQTLQAEKLLLAVGRKPLTENCGLEKSKAKLERGFVHVGENMETAEKGLYAIGDIVAGMPQLAHAAMMEGIIAVTHIAGKPTQQIRKDRIPNATYCEPQIGSIGLTEKQARDAGHAVKVGQVSVRWQQQSHHSWQSRRLHQSCQRRKIRRSPGHSHHRSAGHGNSGRSRGGAEPGRHHRRSDEHGARASHCLGSDGRCIRFGARFADQRLTMRQCDGTLAFERLYEVDRSWA